MDTALKIAKMQASTARIQAATGLFLAVLDNPAVELIAGTILVETWAHNDVGSWSYELAQGLIKTGLEGALAVVCTAKALSPALNSPAAATLVGKYLP